MADDVVETLAEFYVAALAAIEDGAAQPALFLSRHLAELSLKALHSDYRNSKALRTSHDLEEFLDELASRGDELLDENSERKHLVAFIDDFDRHDKRGDQSRYHLTRLRMQLPPGLNLPQPHNDPPKHSSGRSVAGSASVPGHPNTYWSYL